MRYLYGDSTPFPLNQNFIDVVEKATEMCVDLLAIDERMILAQQIAEEANATSMAELADVDYLSQRVEGALNDLKGLSEATGKVAKEVVEMAGSRFDRTRAGIKSWRSATIRRAQEGCSEADMMQPIERFLVRHDLPYTQWGMRWRAGRGDEPMQAQVYALMERGFTATCEVKIPKKHMWEQAMRVGLLTKGLAVNLVGTNWLGKEKLREETLDKYYVTRVTRTAEREALVLSKKAREVSPGYRFVFREGDSRSVTAMRLDDEERPTGESMRLSRSDAETMTKFWREIEETVTDLLHFRHRLLNAALYGKAVGELDTPATLAVAVIQSIAPWVRELVSHSGTLGELQLKRDLGDGRREELFISEQEIIQKYDALAEVNRDLFGEYGLSDARDHQPESPSVEPRAPLMFEELDDHTAYEPPSVPPPPTQVIGPSLLPTPSLPPVKVLSKSLSAAPKSEPSALPRPSAPPVLPKPSNPPAMPKPSSPPLPKPMPFIPKASPPPVFDTASTSEVLPVVSAELEVGSAGSLDLGSIRDIVAEEGPSIVGSGLFGALPKPSSPPPAKKTSNAPPPPRRKKR